MNITLQWSAFGILPDAAQQIRSAVFVEEQGFAEEFDTQDNQSWHLLLYEQDMPCGTARLFYENNQQQTGIMHIGRLAIQKFARKKGFGRMILEECTRQAIHKNAKKLVLGSQWQARGFYQACGFVSVGEPYMDENCKHIMMEKILCGGKNGELSRNLSGNI